MRPERVADIMSKFAPLGPDDCWTWVGTVNIQTGYGSYGKPSRSAHCLVYEIMVGPIPAETLDHTCRNHTCVNPAHLDPVSRGENVLRGNSPPAVNKRKTQCPQGHPYDDENTYRNPKTGWRLCRTCNRER